MEAEHEAMWECPWGWCAGDDAQHELLCMTSKGYFGCSFAHMWSREFIWSQDGADPWRRDEHGAICGREPVAVPPPPGWEPPADE
jgi:hypothetical protein